MAFARSARRPLLAVAIAASTTLALLAGSLSAPLEASAKGPGKAAVSKHRSLAKGSARAAVSKRKKTRHRKHGPRKPRRSAKTGAAAAPIAPPPAPNGQAQAPVRSQPSAPPPRPPRPTASAPPTATAPAATAPAAPSAPSAPTAPSAPATPPPATGAAGDLLFRGASIRDFALAQSAPGAITEVPDPAGSGATVVKMTVSDNDGYPVTPTENPRAELLSPSNIESGDEFWWSASFFLPADFPAFTPNFVGLVQGPYGYPWRGTPPFHIEANGGVLKWQRNQTYDWDIPWQVPLVRNRWVSVLIHERFAPDGWIEMWIDGQQVTFFGPGTYNPNRVAPTTRLAMATMDSSNNERPNSIYVMNYRKKGMFPSLTVYHGPLSIGASRAAVE